MFNKHSNCQWFEKPQMLGENMHLGHQEHGLELPHNIGFIMSYYVISPRCLVCITGRGRLFHSLVAQPWWQAFACHQGCARRLWKSLGTSQVWWLTEWWTLSQPFCTALVSCICLLLGLCKGLSVAIKGLCNSLGLSVPSMLGLCNSLSRNPSLVVCCKLGYF